MRGSNGNNVGVGITKHGSHIVCKQRKNNDCATVQNLTEKWIMLIVSSSYNQL